MVTKLEKMRLARGLSQRRLEELSGVHQQTISRIEKGTALLDKLTTARKLAKVLDCSPSDLIDIDAKFDTLSSEELGTFGAYLKATRELLGLNVRQAARLVGLEDSDILARESEDDTAKKDEILTIAAILYTDFINKKMSAALRVQPEPEVRNRKEGEVLDVFNSLSPEEQERFIHLIKATPLLK